MARVGAAGKNGFVTQWQWSLMCDMVSETGLTFVYGLNARLGYNDSSVHAWDPSNAEKLIRFARSINCPVSGWELGNELNLKTKGFTPELNANHTLQLSKLVENIYGAGSVGAGTPQSPWRIGPDATHSALVPGGGVSDSDSDSESFMQLYYD